MNMKAIQGRNQRGISFVSKSVNSQRFAEIQYSHLSVLSEILHSEKVPEGVIVIDSRLWSFLGLTENQQVSLQPHDPIPKAHTLSLAAISTDSRTPHHKIAEDLWNRMDDFKDDLDGLIVQVGQKIPIPREQVELTVSEIAPESLDGYAQIHWDELLKLVLSRGIESPPFNLCCVIDCGAASRTKDVIDTSIGRPEMIPRYEAGISLISNLLRNLLQDDSCLFSAIAFSTKLEVFHTYDSSTGEELSITTIESRDLIPEFEKWFRGLLETHRVEPSNPALGLERGIELAFSQKQQNSYASVILFLSSGTYSEGPNPVSCARLDDADENIVVIAIGVGENADQELLRGIAEAGKGIFHEYVILEQTPLIISDIQIFISNNMEGIKNG